MMLQHNDSSHKRDSRPTELHRSKPPFATTYLMCYSRRRKFSTKTFNYNTQCAHCTLSDFLLFLLLSLNWYILCGDWKLDSTDIIIISSNYCFDYRRITLISAPIAIGHKTKANLLSFSSFFSSFFGLWLFVRININQKTNFKQFSINGKLKIWLAKLMSAN